MNTTVLIPILIISVLVIGGIAVLVKSKRASNKYNFEKQKLYDATKPGSTFIFYGENGGGDPFTAEEHYIKVMDEKSGWVKLREEIYSADRSKKPYTTTSSYKKENFVNWILLHKDVQFYENINK
jgi:hypothetical protein